MTRVSGRVLVGLFWLVTMVRADDRTADTRRLLDLLDGIRIEYREAFDDDEGELVRPIELEEARLLLVEVRNLDERLQLVGAPALTAIARSLQDVLFNDAVPDEIGQRIEALAASTGVHSETLPPAPPSAARGRLLFDENCATCHAGNDEERRRMRAPDFKDQTFMRRETPLDFFTMMTLGRRKSAMPEWSQAFTLQQRWDAVAYVWGLRQVEADRRAGAELYGEHCAACHGPRAEGVAGKAPDLSRPGALIDRNDVTLLTLLSRARGAMPSFASTLDTRQRWLVTDHLRALSLGGSAAPVALAAPRPAVAVDPRRVLESHGIDPATVADEIERHMHHRFDPAPAK